MKVSLNILVSKLASLGVPGLVLVFAMSLTGWAGAAAITTALAALGGPLGMLGGIALLGLLMMLSNGLSEYGFEAVYKGVVKRLHEQGIDNAEIVAKIDSYPISRSLKRSLREALKALSSNMCTLVMNLPEWRAHQENVRSFDNTITTGIADGFAIAKNLRDKINVGCKAVLVSNDGEKRAEGTISKIVETGRTRTGMLRYDVHLSDDRRMVAFKPERVNRQGVAVITADSR